MPLTDTLRTPEEFRQVGFTEPQAKLLATKLEETIQANNEDLKQFFARELGQMEARLETRLDLRISELRAEMHSSKRELTFKLNGAILGIVTLAVAIIKLFPNWHG